MAQELGLVDVQIAYTGRGRVPFSSEKWPAWLSKTRGRRAPLQRQRASRPRKPRLRHSGTMNDRSVPAAYA